MPKKITMRRKRTIQGAGIMDVLQSIYDKGRNVYNKVKAANTYLKEKQYATKALNLLPQLNTVPVLGTALNLAS